MASGQDVAVCLYGNLRPFSSCAWSECVSLALYSLDQNYYAIVCTTGGNHNVLSPRSSTLFHISSCCCTSALCGISSCVRASLQVGHARATTRSSAPDEASQAPAEEWTQRFLDERALGLGSEATVAFLIARASNLSNSS